MITDEIMLDHADHKCLVYGIVLQIKRNTISDNTAPNAQLRRKLCWYER